MNELSLFTGAGGGLLGTYLLGWTPIGYVEWDDYCQRVIAQRIAGGEMVQVDARAGNVTRVTRRVLELRNPYPTEANAWTAP